MGPRFTHAQQTWKPYTCMPMICMCTFLRPSGSIDPSINVVKTHQIDLSRLVILG